MPKRRRERDRPKAGHDAPYNPNKRVMLSYRSDDEVEDETEAQQAGTGRADAVELATANYEIANYSDEDETGDIAISGDPEPERQSKDVLKEAESYDTKQAISNDSAMWSRTVSKNISTGQWAALGSLSYQWEDGDAEEDFESEEEEAMAYLRAVRSERQGMPTVLKAQDDLSDKEIYESGVGDARGYFEDGAYVARPNLGPELPEATKAAITPLEAFTTALKARFLKQRDQLLQPASAEAKAALDKSHPTTVPGGKDRAHAKWNRLLRTTAPHPAQLRLMKRIAVFRLLALIEKNYLIRETDLPTRVSAWVWSLLAKLEDVGLMDNDHVSVIREFGKKAILVQLSFHDPDQAKELELAAVENEASVSDGDTATVVQDSNEIDLGSDISGPEDDAPENTTVEDEVKNRENTLATLDTIIVIVGEVFRQRDLLDFRQPWSSSEEEI